MNVENVAATFTRRELQVLELILNEKSSATIGLELGISERTVETYRKSIYTKAGVKSIVGLVKYAYIQKMM